MAEDVARAVGSKSSECVMIAGKECIPRPLLIRELGELERDCLQRYRKEYVQAYVDTAGFLPEPERTPFIKEKIDEAAKFKLEDLPPRLVSDPRNIKVTDDLKAWLAENIEGFVFEVNDLAIKRLASLALDSGAMDDSEYNKLVKEPVKKTKTSYIGWWSTGTIDGMVSMAHLIVRGNGITREQILDELGKNPSLLTQISREIERLTAPEMGNGQGSV